MRWAIGIALVGGLALVAYESFRSESRPPVVEGPVRPALPAADSADQAASAPAERTRAITERAASEARQVAADAARRMQETAERVAKAAQDVANSSTALTTGDTDTDIGKGLTDAVDGVAVVLGDIFDQASAEAAVPKLVAIDARLYELKPRIERLPDDARAALATLVTGVLPKVRSAVDRVAAASGAESALKPALDPILAKLDAWARGPA